MAATPQLGGPAEIEYCYHDDPPPNRRTPRECLDGSVQKQQTEEPRESRTRCFAPQKRHTTRRQRLSLVTAASIVHFVCPINSCRRSSPLWVSYPKSDFRRMPLGLLGAGA